MSCYPGNTKGFRSYVSYAFITQEITENYKHPRRSLSETGVKDQILEQKFLLEPLFIRVLGAVSKTEVIDIYTYIMNILYEYIFIIS